MRQITVSSIDHADVLRLKLLNRLRAGFDGFPVRLSDSSAVFGIPQDCLHLFISSLAGFLIEDLREAELTRLVTLLPVDKRIARLIVPEAERALSSNAALKLIHKELAERELSAYFSRSDFINAEGFLRFRLSSVVDDWAKAVDRAGEELISLVGIREAMPLITALVAPFRHGNGSELTVILFDDGSCSVSSSSGAAAGFECIDPYSLSVYIISLDPDFIKVFDLTEYGSHTAELLVSLLSGRAVLFKRSI